MDFDNKRIAKNTLFLYARMFFVLIVSLYTSRIVLRALGVEDYGINNVVAGFVSLFTFLNASLSSSMQRFYNVETVTNGTEGFKKVYITGLIIHVLFAGLVFLLLETVGLWYVNQMMVIPAERMAAANVLYQTSIVALLFVILQIPYAGAVMASERLDFYALVSVIDTTLKLGMVFSLQFVSYDKLVLFGVLSLVVNIVDFFLFYGYCRLKFAGMRFKFQYDATLFRSIMGLSGWNILGTFSFMLKWQGVSMLLNLFFGPLVNAARGIASQVNNAVSGFSPNVTIAFRPQIMNSYAVADYLRVKKLMFIESKICFMLIATLITPLVLDIDYILSLWLGGVVPEKANLFTVLVLLDLLVCTLNTPCTQIALAAGELKRYQIASMFVTVSVFPVSFILLKCGFEASSVFIATIIVSLLNQLVCLVVVNKIFPYGLSDYIKNVLLPCFLFALFIPIFPLLIYSIMEMSFLRLLLIVACDLLVGMTLCYFLGLDAQQRKSVRAFVIRKMMLVGKHSDNM